MAVTEAQARRVVRRAEFEWDSAVKDPRSTRNQLHGHQGLLSAMAVAFACGLFHLRRVEDFTDDLPKGARRRWGLKKRVSDTTFYRVLSEQDPRGLRETAYAQVRDLIERKVIRHDELFKVGVLSIDGKCSWTSSSKEVEGAKRAVNEETGVVTSSLTTLRGVLTSSSVRPCLDMEFLAEKKGESTAFRNLLPRVCGRFRGQFGIVTVDAGMTGRENALVVRGQDKHYLMALKGNQLALHAVAVPLFQAPAQEPRLCSMERRNGSRVFRELYTVKVENLPEAVPFPDARELWCVRQLSEPEKGSSAKPTSQTRYFISSMPSDFLSPSQKLTLVRLHWGIENGHHWTLDVPMEEDDVQPCQASRKAIEVVAWLRVLAFNLISAWRAQRPTPISWERAMELLRDTVVHLATDRVFATLA